MGFSAGARDAGEGREQTGKARILHGSILRFNSSKASEPGGECNAKARD
jgi:hypothetical protein